MGRDFAPLNHGSNILGDLPSFAVKYLEFHAVSLQIRRRLGHLTRASDQRQESAIRIARLNRARPRDSESTDCPLELLPASHRAKSRRIAISMTVTERISIMPECRTLDPTSSIA